MQKRFAERLWLDGDIRQRHQAIVPENHTPADVVTNTYWLAVLGDLKPGDLLEVEPRDASWRLELRVMGVDSPGQRVIVAPLQYWSLRSDVAIPEGYDLVFEGLAWRVFRDGKPLRGGFASEVEASLWLLADRGLQEPEMPLPEAAPVAQTQPGVACPSLSVRFEPKGQHYVIVDEATKRPVSEETFRRKTEAEKRRDELLMTKAAA